MRRLIIAWIVLVALAAVSFAASYLHLGRLGVPVAVVIAAIKAGVVFAIFMDLSEERASTRLTIAGALALIVVFVTIVSADPATRDPAPAGAELQQPITANR